MSENHEPECHFANCTSGTCRKACDCLIIRSAYLRGRSDEFDAYLGGSIAAHDKEVLDAAVERVAQVEVLESMRNPGVEYLNRRATLVATHGEHDPAAPVLAAIDALRKSLASGLRDSLSIDSDELVKAVDDDPEWSAFVVKNWDEQA